MPSCFSLGRKEGRKEEELIRIMMCEVMGNFSELPGDVLYVIARKLLTLSDFVRFGAVCISWRLASLANPKHCKLLSLLPVLLLPSPSTDDNEHEEDHDHNQQTDDEEVDVCIWQLQPTDEEEEDVVDDDDDEEEEDVVDDDDDEEEDVVDDDEEDEDKEDEDQQIDDEDEEEEDEDNEDQQIDDEDEEEEDEDNEDQQIDDDEDNEDNEDEDKQIDDDDDDDDDDDEDNKDEDKQIDEYEDTEKTKTNTITRSLYSLYDGKVHDVQLRVGGDCRSSSHGWLVVTTEADQNYSVRLLNPFISLNNEIELPPLTTFQISSHGTRVRSSNYLIKAVISASPSSCSNPKDIVVMAIHGCYTLSFCRPGDKAWTALPHKWGHVFEDIIYYNGLFYGIIQSGSLFAIEIDPLHAKLKVFKELIHVPLNHAGRKYIVESSGELLQVWRKIDHSRLFKYKTVCVDIFKLDQTRSNSKWVKIKTLNGRMLFLGHNASISLLASDFPGCKPNCIYFTDDNEGVFLSESSSLGPHDIGIYNLEDGSFEPHYRMLTKDVTPHPIWIQPTL